MINGEGKSNGEGGPAATQRARRRLGHRGVRRRSAILRALALGGAAWLGMAATARAALVITPDTLVLELAPGRVGIVRGDITNTTGFDLLSSDFFGSFSGFPVDALVVDPLLGLTEVTIGDRSVAHDLPLFSIRPGTAAVPGARYAIEFFFGDINGNFSEASTALVDIPSGQQIPEPGVAWLVCTGLLALAATRRRPPFTLQET